MLETATVIVILVIRITRCERSSMEVHSVESTIGLVETTSRIANNSQTVRLRIVTIVDRLPMPFAKMRQTRQNPTESYHRSTKSFFCFWQLADATLLIAIVKRSAYPLPALL